MRYTVAYAEAAQDKLALIWMAATEQQAVADASDEIDRLLVEHPLEVGEPFNVQGAEGTGNGTGLARKARDYRWLYVAPLEVIYTVSPDDRLVQVWDVHYLPDPGAKQDPPESNGEPA